MGLLVLGALDVAGALLVSPSTAAVFVADPLRPDWVLWARAVFAVGPGVALSLALCTTCAIGAGAVLAGLFGSLQYDTPSGPSIVVAALVFFLVSLLPAVHRVAGRRETGR